MRGASAAPPKPPAIEVLAEAPHLVGHAARHVVAAEEQLAAEHGIAARPAARPAALAPPGARTRSRRRACSTDGSAARAFAHALRSPRNARAAERRQARSPAHDARATPSAARANPRQLDRSVAQLLRQSLGAAAAVPAARSGQGDEEGDEWPRHRGADSSASGPRRLKLTSGPRSW